jgi:hypothetical protein
MEAPPNGSTTTVEYCASSPTASGYRLPHPQQHHQQYHHHWLPAIQGSTPVMQQVPYRDNNYPQHPYPGVSSNMMPPSTTAAPPIDLALATAGGWAPPAPRPMPVPGVMPQPAINSLYAMMPYNDPPSRVVLLWDHTPIFWSPALDQHSGDGSWTGYSAHQSAPTGGFLTTVMPQGTAGYHHPAEYWQRDLRQTEILGGTSGAPHVCQQPGQHGYSPGSMAVIGGVTTKTTVRTVPVDTEGSLPKHTRWCAGDGWG